MAKQARKPLRGIAERNALLLANIGIVRQITNKALRSGVVRRACQTFDDAFQLAILGAPRGAELYDPKILNGHGQPHTPGTYIGASAKRRLCREATKMQGGIINVPACAAKATIEGDGAETLRTRQARKVLAGVANLQATDGPEGDWLHDHRRNAGDAETVEVAQLVRHAVRTLPAKDRMVIGRRFGLTRHGKQTLPQIAAVMGTSKQRVAQIEMRGMSRLRKKMKAMGLGDAI